MSTVPPPPPALPPLQERVDRQQRQIAALRRRQEELAGELAKLQRSEQRLARLLEGLGSLRDATAAVAARDARAAAGRPAPALPPPVRPGGVRPLPGRVLMVKKRQAVVQKRQAALRQQQAALRQRQLVLAQRQQLRTMALHAQIDKVTAVVNSAQSTAFGQKGSITAPNNLMLTANQLFWSFLDPVLQKFNITSGASPSLVAWLAPLGVLATGQLALGGQQHERFVSGVVTFPSASLTVRASLRGLVADSMWQELQRGRVASATATALDQAGVFTARVRRGVVEITRVNLGGGGIPIIVVPLPPPPRVAWMVDLGADIG